MRKLLIIILLLVSACNGIPREPAQCTDRNGNTYQGTAVMFSTGEVLRYDITDNNGFKRQIDADWSEYYTCEIQRKVST